MLTSAPVVDWLPFAPNSVRELPCRGRWDPCRSFHLTVGCQAARGALACFSGLFLAAEPLSPSCSVDGGFQVRFHPAFEGSQNSSRAGIIGSIAE